ncbi:MAG: response regulator [Nitrososphaerales archaeon]
MPVIISKKSETTPATITPKKTVTPKDVCIVDDNVGIRNAYAAVLKARGHKVVLTASSGEEIMSEPFRSKLRDIDVVIMDYLMGPMNGLQAAAAVLEYNPRIKMIIASGEDEIENQISISGLAYLRKPFSSSDVLKLIEE